MDLQVQKGRNEAQNKHNDGDFQNIYLSKYPEYRAYSCEANCENVTSFVAFMTKTEKNVSSDAA